MAKNKKIKPTEAELQVLRVIWKDGPSTVRYVNDRLNETKHAGYTTTLKIMQIMLDKGLLSREVKENRHIYNALIGEKETQSLLVDRIVTTAFAGSASRLIMQALGNYKTSKKELDMIKEMINKLEQES